MREIMEVAKYIRKEMRMADEFAYEANKHREQYPDMFDENGNFKQADEPIEFPLNGVIKGWTEGLQLMPIGSKFRLFIPYQLAYGEQGAGELIGPCEALIFEVELLDIVK